MSLKIYQKKKTFFLWQLFKRQIKILIIIGSAHFVPLTYETYYIGYIKLYAEIQDSFTNYAVYSKRIIKIKREIEREKERRRKRTGFISHDQSVRRREQALLR